MWNSEKVDIFRQKLLAWFEFHKRKLPWRRSISPYRTWISEIMLQQTQAKTVIPYYERFLIRFPNIESLARAAEAEILELWSGLGYYTRARNIHRAAKLILEKHGTFPQEYEKVIALPGIGRYTAGAICSIAFDQPYPIVDGNIRRVLTRLQGIRGHVPDKYFWDIMSAWVPAQNPSGFNQAMMELGALVCIPGHPRCSHCPALSICRAQKLGIADTIPAVPKRDKARNIKIILLILESGSRILIKSAGKRDLIPGKWGIPWHILEPGEPGAKAALRFSRKMVEAEIRLQAGMPLRHSIMNNRITGLVYHGKMDGSKLKKLRAGEFRWIERTSAEKFLTSSIFHKALRGS